MPSPRDPLKCTSLRIPRQISERLASELDLIPYTAARVADNLRRELVRQARQRLEEAHKLNPLVAREIEPIVKRLDNLEGGRQ